MIHFAYRDWAKNLTVDEDYEKTLHQRIEMTETRNNKAERHAFIEKEFMQSEAKLSYNFLGSGRPKNDRIEAFRTTHRRWNFTPLIPFLGLYAEHARLTKPQTNFSGSMAQT